MINLVGKNLIKEMFMKFVLSMLVGWSLIIANALATEMPTELRGQTVTIVIPYAAGGQSDSWYRLLTRQVTTNTGLNMVIVNKPGAGSNIGTAEVAAARPTGLTLLGTDSTSLVLNPLMNLKGSSSKYQFSTVSVNLVTAQGIYVAPNSKYNNLKELITDLKKDSSKINYGCSTAVCQISMARMLDYYKIDMPMIRYNSTPQILTDVIGGTLTFGPTDPTGLNMSRSGKVKPIAFSGEHTIKEFPKVGLYKDIIPGFVVENFVGLWAPAGTPTHIVNYYNSVFRDAVNSQETQDIVAQRGSRTLDLTVSGSDAYVARSIHVWKPLVDRYYRSEN
jgi:tripartite-type tricarboxylate transporter receptor subunit TctC